jgi:prepilin-type N-terminal cleavage/methylation domain-containing protein
MKRKNEKGFTLVEVIVVAVIVAVLAAVAIPLYIGYINDANRNSAQNAAGAFASFMAAAANSQSVAKTAIPAAISDATGALVVTTPAPGSQDISYTCPTGVTLANSVAFAAGAVIMTGGTVTGTRGNQTGTAIAY